MKIILCLLLVLLPVHVLAIDPDTLMKEIKRNGPRQTMRSLWNENRYTTDWFKILEGIRSGDSKWLHAAVALKPVADASMSTDLNAALAESLPKQPVKVLVLLAEKKKNGFRVADVCTDPYVEESDEKVLTFLEGAEHAVAAASVPKKAESTRIACVKKLKSIKEAIVKKKKTTLRHYQPFDDVVRGHVGW